MYLQCPWYGGSQLITPHTVISAWCLLLKKGVAMKKKWTVSYPNIPSAIRLVPHGERLPVPEPPEMFSVDSDGDDKNDEHQLHLHSNEEQPSTSKDPEFCRSLDSSKPHKITRKHK
jgi:hypothetical protein